MNLIMEIKPTGIVRRIDELGRLIIPKSVRKSFDIKEDDPIEIFVDSNGYILLRKYEPEQS